MCWYKSRNKIFDRIFTRARARSTNRIEAYRITIVCIYLISYDCFSCDSWKRRFAVTRNAISCWFIESMRGWANPISVQNVLTSQIAKRWIFKSRPTGIRYEYKSPFHIELVNWVADMLHICSNFHLVISINYLNNKLFHWRGREKGRTEWLLKENSSERGNIQFNQKWSTTTI